MLIQYCHPTHRPNNVPCSHVFPCPVWDHTLHVVITAPSRAPSAGAPAAGSSDSRAAPPVLSSGESPSARRNTCPGRRVQLPWNLPEDNPNVAHRRVRGGEGPRRQPPCLKFTFTAEVDASSSCCGFDCRVIRIVQKKLSWFH